MILNVMLVDNEVSIREGLMNCMDWHSKGFQIVAQARDGVEAMEYIPRVNPHIIISDVRMPIMDGILLAQNVYENYPQIKVIILTGYPDFEYAQKAINYRVVDFILKPTSIESITAAVEKAKRQIMEEQGHQDLYKSLKNTSMENLELSRSLFLHKLIHKENLSHLFIYNQMGELQMNLSGYYVLCVMVGATGNVAENTDYRPVMEQVKTVLTDCFAGAPVYFAVSDEQICYAVLCVEESPNPVELCDQAINSLNETYSFSISAGLSSYSHSPLAVRQATKEARQAQLFAEYSPDWRVVRFSQMPAMKRDDLSEIIDNLKVLKAAIEHNNLSSTQDILKHIFTNIRQAKIPFSEIRNVYLFMYSFCMEFIFSQDAEGYLMDQGISAINQAIEDEDIENIEAAFTDFVQQIIHRTSENFGTPEQLIVTLKKYIEDHYSQDITLDFLAGKVYLSPSYLSKLFKRETGENISTFIQNVRIENAKRLLLSTNLKTYEVAELVGISDPVYFSRIFKKITGVKPKEFKSLSR